MIERWVRDPANMRLLRVALDVFPHEKALNVVLDLLKQYVGVGTKRKAPRRIAWYCTGELLRAAATETGLVADGDCLPAGVDLTRYQAGLIEIAEKIVDRRNTYPWYLEQQAHLFLACVGRYIDRQLPRATDSHLTTYLRLHHALNGNAAYLRREDIVPFTLLRKHFQGAEVAAQMFLECIRPLGPSTQRRLLLRVLQEDSELAKAIQPKMTVAEQETWSHLYRMYGESTPGDFPSTADAFPAHEASYSLLDVARSPENPFHQEYAALHFAMAILGPLSQSTGAICPSRIIIHAANWRNLVRDKFPIPPDAITVQIETAADPDARFQVPEWVGDENAWRYQLGQILRVLLTGHPDFTFFVPRSRSQPSLTPYTPYRSSWLRRRYGLFNGRNAFGPNWLPISSWMGSLLSRLLEWPGCVRNDYELELPDDFSIETLRQIITARVAELADLYGRASSTPFLPVRIPKLFPKAEPQGAPEDAVACYKMRIGIVQTCIPSQNMFAGDPRLLLPATRFRQRRHISAVLGGVHRMLQVRETHRDDGAGVELLLFPELCVHPDDLHTHLVPFAVQHHCMVFAGMVFHEPTPNAGWLINSGCWIIPYRDRRGSVHVQYLEQGKWNLTDEELNLGITQFRPVQWILQFVTPPTGEPIWSMSGAICYDATDLCLAADLRDRTDMFVVPALNPDVGTFDAMAAALHYHMFQHVIVANTGEFGGSTGQAPFRNRHHRTIFHSHGNEQTTISFFEVDLETYRVGGSTLKTPPAGYRRWA